MSGIFVCNMNPTHSHGLSIWNYSDIDDEAVEVFEDTDEEYHFDYQLVKNSNRLRRTFDNLNYYGIVIDGTGKPYFMLIPISNPSDVTFIGLTKEDLDYYNKPSCYQKSDNEFILLWGSYLSTNIEVFVLNTDTEELTKTNEIEIIPYTECVTRINFIGEDSNDKVWFELLSAGGTFPLTQTKFYLMSVSKTTNTIVDMFQITEINGANVIDTYSGCINIIDNYAYISLYGGSNNWLGKVNLSTGTYILHSTPVPPGKTFAKYNSIIMFDGSEKRFLCSGKTNDSKGIVSLIDYNTTPIIISSAITTDSEDIHDTILTEDGILSYSFNKIYRVVDTIDSAPTLVVDKTSLGSLSHPHTMSIMGECPNVSTPDGLIGEQVDDTISLEWNDIDDIRIIGYEVYRGEVEGEEELYLTLQKLPGVIDSEIESWTTYYYYIKTIFRDGTRSDESNHISVGTQGIILPPSNVASEANYSEINLSWEEPENVEHIIRYDIYRNGELLTPIDVGTTSYTDSNVESGIEYEYVMYSITEDGQSEPSNSATSTAYGPDEGVEGVVQPLLSIEGRGYRDIAKPLDWETFKNSYSTERYEFTQNKMNVKLVKADQEIEFPIVIHNDDMSKFDTFTCKPIVTRRAGWKDSFYFNGIKQSMPYDLIARPQSKTVVDVRLKAPATVRDGEIASIILVAQSKTSIGSWDYCDSVLCVAVTPMVTYAQIQTRVEHLLSSEAIFPDYSSVTSQQVTENFIDRETELVIKDVPERLSGIQIDELDKFKEYISLRVIYRLIERTAQLSVDGGGQFASTLQNLQNDITRLWDMLQEGWN